MNIKSKNLENLIEIGFGNGKSVWCARKNCAELLGKLGWPGFERWKEKRQVSFYGLFDTKYWLNRPSSE